MEYTEQDMQFVREFTGYDILNSEVARSKVAGLINRYVGQALAAERERAQSITNAPTPREQELMALVEECERVISYFSQFTIIKAKKNSLGVTYFNDGEHTRKALAAIQKAKGV